ncbi:GDP-mannose 4,6-dehydratase [Mariprofundus erugo]|uniref:GDP-mannose 4,6-dehydratase n=1 Tax=Mariprofundus erugo TaxID=2528639 RepID=UPI0010FED086|nr:GDP-mannose 4,6-dehydratase [Mariprofundus erugo]TLS78415.1 GDP-mannose 4,6-dehydratase [Mariprofundus erugo]
MSKRALICGVSGQDGAFLAKLLLDKGYQVVGTARDAQMSSFRSLDLLGIRHRVETVSMSLVDFRSVIQVLSKVSPHEVYNLAGQSSVGLSFEQPVETLESHAMGTLNLLEAIRFLGQPVRFYNACSGECFGDTGVGKSATEETAFRPRSPYAVAKAAAFWEVANYRDAYGIYACSGILFNHESNLRPERFVTQKIIAAACRIANGSKEQISLGNLNISRDWGWAPEYVDAMWRMLQLPDSEDFVIATGESNSLQSFVEEAFKCVNLDWREYVRTDDSLLRPSEIMHGCGSPIKAGEKLGWYPAYKMKDVVRKMVELKLNGSMYKT